MIDVLLEQLFTRLKGAASVLPDSGVRRAAGKLGISRISR